MKGPPWLRLLALIAALAALSGCGPLQLRPRSAECTAVTALVGIGCEPMERMSDGADEEAKRFVPSAGKGSVYVVRPSIVGGRYVWTIQVDGKTIGAVAEHAFMLLTIEPGHHEVAVLTGENRHAIVVNVDDSENLFVEVVAKLGWTESARNCAASSASRVRPQCAARDASSPSDQARCAVTRRRAGA